MTCKECIYYKKDGGRKYTPPIAPGINAPIICDACYVEAKPINIFDDRPACRYFKEIDHPTENIRDRSLDKLLYLEGMHGHTKEEIKNQIKNILKKGREQDEI